MSTDEFSKVLDKIINQLTEVIDRPKVKDCIAYLFFKCLYKKDIPAGLFDDDITSAISKDNIDAIESIIKEENIDFNTISFDFFGFIFEYLTQNFEGISTKSTGEYFSPAVLSKLSAFICDPKKEVYEPTIGTGSLLNSIDPSIKVYGQEKSPLTAKFCQLNLLLKGFDPNNFEIAIGNTLTEDAFKDKKFECIISNPPYSIAWPRKELEKDERFVDYPLAPKSKCDYAFILHSLHKLDDKGTMVAVLPHGVLFRGQAEGNIRKQLLKENMIDAVIGLPANIFMNTSIPVCMIVFKKNREKDDVLFIDASKEFIKEKKQNIVTEEGYKKIIDAYTNRKDVDKFAHVASADEIKDNTYNLNIPRYVDTFEEEELVDLDKVCNEIKEIDNKIDELDKQLEVFFKELGVKNYV